MAATPSFWLGQFFFVFSFSTLDRVWYFWHEGRKIRILNRKLEEEGIKASKELEQRNALQIKGVNYFRRKCPHPMRFSNAYPNWFHFLSHRSRLCIRLRRWLE